MKKAKDVDEYIAGAPKEIEGKLKEIRRIIKEVAPKAREKISYSMPYYDYCGRLAYFAYFKDHISLFAMPPIPEEYRKDLKITGRSTIQFSLDQKLPIAIIKKLIKAGAKRNEIKRGI